MRWKEGARFSLGFDLRSLALLRIAVATVYLYDLASNFSHVEALYCDTGLQPRRLLSAFQEGPRWSLYFATGAWSGVVLLYVLHMLIVAALLAGFRTRWASLFCFCFAYSLQCRSEAVPGWEGEIRLLLLYGVFLPWGECLSWDGLRKSRLDVSRYYVSWATVAWRLQLVAFYVGAGLFKGGPFWREGTAVEVALHSDAYATVWAARLLEFLKPYPGALTWLNDTVPVAEIVFPLFTLLPHPWLQMLGVAGLWFLHLTFGLCLDLDLFSLVCAVCLLAYLPGSLWTSWGWARLSGERQPFPLKPWESAFLVWVILVTWWTTFTGLREFRHWIRPRAYLPARALGLESRWSMFVPPPVDGGWHLVRGQLSSGQWVDLLNQVRDPSEEQPVAIHAIYPNVRFYLFFAYYLRSRQERLRPLQRAASDYFRRSWEAKHPAWQDRVRRLEIVYFHRRYRAGKGYGKVERRLIYRQDYL